MIPDRTPIDGWGVSRTSLDPKEGWLQIEVTTGGVTNRVMLDDHTAILIARSILKIVGASR